MNEHEHRPREPGIAEHNTVNHKQESSADENSEVILARQPIINRLGHCVGHELLFRNLSRNVEAIVNDDFACTMNVMQNLIGTIGVDTVLEELDGFLNCNDEVLASEFIDVLPSQQIVLEILETVELTDALAQHCLALKEKGFRIALDDVRELSSQVLGFLPYVDLIKIDWPFIEKDVAARITAKVHSAGKKVLAEKVETREDYANALEIGCDLFQGFFFTRPQLVKGTSVSANATSWLNLLAMTQRDAKVDEIEKALKTAAPSLTVQILRMANSNSWWRNQISEIRSVRQALMLVGMKQLTRWCCFMLYGASKNNTRDPLVRLVAHRADFMERIARKTSPDDDHLQQEAYLTALLSLAHIPHGMDEKSFMSGVAVGPSIHNAIISRDGWLGSLLILAECLEKGEAPSPAQLKAVSPINGQSLLDGIYL